MRFPGYSGRKNGIKDKYFEKPLKNLQILSIDFKYSKCEINEDKSIDTKKFFSNLLSDLGIGFLALENLQKSTFDKNFWKL